MKFSRLRSANSIANRTISIAIETGSHRHPPLLVTHRGVSQVPRGQNERHRMNHAPPAFPELARPPQSPLAGDLTVIADGTMLMVQHVVAVNGLTSSPRATQIAAGATSFAKLSANVPAGCSRASNG
jgi:hypothetical protein